MSALAMAVAFSALIAFDIVHPDRAWWLPGVIELGLLVAIVVRSFRR